MKVFVEAYLFGNLGDDLFMDILLKRYPKTNFITISNYYKSKFGNIKVCKPIIMKRKILLNLKKSLLRRKTNIMITIGGSMFMEGESINYIPRISNNYYVLGTNFGPYYTHQYFEKYENIFKKANDVCFRDDFSYDLFKHLKNVRKASDIVFNLNTDKIKKNNSKKVIISVILCRNNLLQYRCQYEQKIIDFIYYFITQDYEVCLMSFCQLQGDEIAIESIKQKCDLNFSTYYYRGNRSEALSVLADCSIVIGTRFHANVLGILFEKIIIPISYSEKTKNFLKSSGYKGKIIDLKNIGELDMRNFDLKDFTMSLNIEKLSQEAQLQFLRLDKILE